LITASVKEYQAALFKALGHPTRLRIVEILATEGGKCVCELSERLGFDQSTISKHLALLKTVGIVSSTKEGLKVIYKLEMNCAYQFMKCVEDVVSKTGSNLRCGFCNFDPGERQE